ncbi:MAG TPA: hypothetical protein VNT54_03365, partial [Solirubrobacteraceae bacterium]|nr:hypothetical protein [Solirubrobacteraceae bacterium]
MLSSAPPPPARSTASSKASRRGDADAGTALARAAGLLSLLVFPLAGLTILRGGASEGGAGIGIPAPARLR